MINLYQSPWDKISHGLIALTATLVFGLYGAIGAVCWFHSREYSTATIYMNSRSLLLLIPMLWDWKPKEDKPTWQDTQLDFYVVVAGVVAGMYYRNDVIEFIGGVL